MSITTQNSFAHNTSTPLIHIDFINPITSQAFEQWLDEMTGLLTKKQPFFAMYHSQIDLVLPENYRAKEALWYKAHKAEFFQYCQGVVRIATDEAEREKRDTPALHQAWGVPYAVVMTQAQAMEWINQQVEKA